MKKFWCLSILTIFFAWNAFGQQQDRYQESQPDSQVFASGSGIGFVAGLASGLGIGYREHFANKWGFQIAGGGVGWSGWAGADLGFQTMRTLSKLGITRFYLLGALSGFYTASRSFRHLPIGPKMLEPEPKDGDMFWFHNVRANIGVGVGMEFHFSKSIGLALEVPLSLSIDFSSQGTEFAGVWPIPSAALTYYF